MSLKQECKLPAIKSMKKLAIKWSMKNSISIYIILLILIFVAGYFILKNIPYWNFKFQNKEVIGKVIAVDNLRNDTYKIKYSFYSPELKKERIRTINSHKKLTVGDSVTVLYNAKYPNYVEIKELGSPLNFNRTLLAVIIPIFCIILILLGMFGIIDLDKLS